jgi:hypothetical protein
MHMIASSSSEKYLIYRCAAHFGLGHTLLSILGSARYALISNRVLLLDTREFKYCGEPHQSFKDEFLIEAPSSLFVSDDLELIDNLYLEPDRTLLLGEALFHWKDLFHEGRIIIVPGGYFPFQIEKDPKIRIKLRGQLGCEFQRIVDRYSTMRPIIGIHFRAANGEFLHGRFDSTYPNSQFSWNCLIDEYVNTCNRICSSSSDARILLTSNSTKFISVICDRVPGVIPFTAYKDERCHQNYTLMEDGTFLRQAVLDLWALSECDHLICAESAFSEFAFQNSRRLTSRTVIHGPFFPGSRTGERMKEILRKSYTYIDSEEFETWGNALQNVGQTEEVAKIRRHQGWLKYTSNPKWIESIKLIRAGDFEAGCDVILKWIKNDPDNPYLLVHMAELCRIKGDLRTAELYIRSALNCGDPSPWFYHDLACVLADQRRHVEAIAAASQALALMPHSELLRRSLDHLLASRWKRRWRWGISLIQKARRWLGRVCLRAAFGRKGYMYVIETIRGDGRTKNRVIRRRVRQNAVLNSPATQT